MKKASFILTGASASGKTTIINEAKKEGYIYLPTHMTRKPRTNEVDGIDMVSISEQEFVSNFNEGMYIEPSLEFAYLKNIEVYYGSPKEWLEKLSKFNYCATPTSITVSQEVVEKSRVKWIHLFCDDEDRYKRLIARGIKKEEALARMISGESVNMPEESDVKINTSKYSPSEIIEIINNL